MGTKDIYELEEAAHIDGLGPVVASARVHQSLYLGPAWHPPRSRSREALPASDPNVNVQARRLPKCRKVQVQENEASDVSSTLVKQFGSGGLGLHAHERKLPALDAKDKATSWTRSGIVRNIRLLARGFSVGERVLFGEESAFDQGFCVGRQGIEP